MIFDLIKDLAEVLDAMPKEHPRHRILKLLDKAIRRDVHFIDRHPTTFFQCMWNTCWWYDCPEAAKHYEEPEEGWEIAGPPWNKLAPKLCNLLNDWKIKRDVQSWALPWIRSLRPPYVHLDSAQFVVLRGHAELIKCVAYSPLGKIIVSGGYNGEVRVWNITTGVNGVVLEGHKKTVVSVAFSPDGRRIVSGSEDMTIRVWNAGDGTELAKVRESVNCVAFSPDGQHVASVWGSTIRMFNASNLVEIAVLQSHRDHLTSVAFSPDGSRLVSGSGDGIVRVWDILVRTELACSSKHFRKVNSVAFSLDGQQIIYGCADNTIRILSADSCAEQTLIRGHESDVNSVAFSPDGRRIVSGSGGLWGGDTTVRLWSAETGEELKCFRGHQDFVTGVAFSPDGRWVVSASWDKTLRVWETEPESRESDTRADSMRLRGHDARITHVVYSPNGRQIASGSVDSTVRLWDSEQGYELHVLRGHKKLVSSLVYTRDGTKIVSGSRDHTVRVWDTVTGNLITTLENLRLLPDITCVACSPDGSSVAAGGLRSICVWDVGTGEVLAELNGHANDVTAIAFSPDGELIVSGSTYRECPDESEQRMIHFYDSSYRYDDDTVRIWSIVNAAPLTVLRGHHRYVNRVMFSSDGLKIISGDYTAIRIWDAKSGECMNMIEPGGGVAECVEILAECRAEGFRAISTENETIIRAFRDPTTSAYFTQKLSSIGASHQGRTWAGGVINDLRIIRLNGGPEG